MNNTFYGQIEMPHPEANISKATLYRNVSTRERNSLLLIVLYSNLYK